MSHEILLRQLELGSEDIAFVVIAVLRTEGPTAVKAGNKAIILSDGSIEGWVGGHCTENEIVTNAMASLRDGSSRTLNLTTCHGGIMDVYLEPYLPKRKLIIFGHVPIVSALSTLAHSLNFHVTVVDKLVSKEKFPDTDVVLNSIEDLGEKINPQQTFAVIATMGERDQEYAEKLANLGVLYVGIVAGKKRATEVVSYLRSVGLSEETMTRIRAPAGIYIRSVTAGEIALSIMAEIVEYSRAQHAAGVPNLAHADRKSSPRVFVDPVCGMTVEEADTNIISTIGNKTVYFCSGSCKATFDANPGSFLPKQSTA